MDQHRLLNSTKQETFIGAIMESRGGQKSVRKVDNRQINMATGNVAIHSDFMNGPYQLLQFQQENSLAATLDKLHSEKVTEKESTAENKIIDQAEKVGKKAEQKNKYKETKERIIPGQEKNVAAGIDVVVTLPNKRLS